MAAKIGNFYSHQSLDGLIITAQFLSESLYLKEQAFQSFTVDSRTPLDTSRFMPGKILATLGASICPKHSICELFTLGEKNVHACMVYTECTKIAAVSCGTSRYSKTRYKKLFTL